MILSFVYALGNTKLAMTQFGKAPKIVVIGAGPVGALSALYAARRGDQVEVYELRGGKLSLYYRGSQADQLAKRYVQAFQVGIAHIYLQIQEILKQFL